MGRKERKARTDARVRELRAALAIVARDNGITMSEAAEACAKHRDFSGEAHLLRRAARVNG